MLFSYASSPVGHATTTPASDDPAAQAGTAAITVNPGVTHQTMRGWEVTAQANQIRPDFFAFQNAALDKVVEAGINRVRLEIRSGAEHTNDVYAEWRDAGFPTSGAGYTAWRSRRYETINDNSDANGINTARFHFTDFDTTVDRVVNPLRQRLAARGEQLWVNLTYVSFYHQVTSGAPNVHASPAEYAEFMLATFQHLQQKYGWVPNSLEVMLEPDNVPNPWTGTYMGQVIAATGPKLAASGFRPDFVGPSTTCMNNAVSYFDQMMAVPGVSQYLKELTYHRYCGSSASTVQTIASRAQAAGISTGMLEWWDPSTTFHTLHEDLKSGRNSVWEQSSIVDLADANSLAVSYVNPATPTVATMTTPTKFTQQYFKHVRRGAVRVDATSGNAAFDPLAFRNANGLYTVVVKAGSGGTVSIDGLPAGTYGIYYTASTAGSWASPDLFAVSNPDQSIGVGQSLTTSIPAYGVLTVYGKTAAPTPPVATNDNYSTAYGQALTVAAPGVVGNDTPNGGGTLTATLVSAATSGTVSLSATGGFTYTPAPGFSGAASFTYRASNTYGQSNVATVTVTVAAPSSPPVATNDSYSTAYGQALTVAAPGVVGNDMPNGGGTLTATLVSAATSGTVSLSASGGFTYTPAPGFSGAASFTYRASNTYGQSNVATVTVAVGASTTAANDSYATPFGTRLTVSAPGVLANDTANGSGTLSSSIVNTTARGLLTLAPNGSFTYTPGETFTGVDTFSYRASNESGIGATAVVSITVAAPGEPLPPERVRVKRVSGNKVTFAWSIPKSGPAPTAFRIEGGRVPGEVLGVMTVGAVPTATVNWPSGSYFARVRAVAGEAVSAPSPDVPVKVNSPTAPSAPSSLVGLADGDTLDLSWTNTYTGGEPTRVILRVEGAVNTSVPLGLTDAFRFSGVPPGTYTLSVVAANDDGASAPSNPVTLTFPSSCAQVPAAVENVAAHAVGRTLFVNWEPPASGAAPSGYVLQVTGRYVARLPTPSTLKTVSGLVAPGTYHFTVAATNACGSGPASQVQTVVGRGGNAEARRRSRVQACRSASRAVSSRHDTTAMAHHRRQSRHRRGARRTGEGRGPRGDVHRA